MTRTAGGRHIGASLYCVAAIWSGKEPLRGAKVEYRGSQEERQLYEKIGSGEFGFRTDSLPKKLNRSLLGEAIRERPVNQNGNWQVQTLAGECPRSNRRTDFPVPAFSNFVSRRALNSRF